MPPLTVSRCSVVERGRRNKIVKFLSTLTEVYPVKSSGLAAESLPEILNTPCPAVTITAARARNSGAARN
ncbi:jg23133 [Pararge aegeria aegeria]|uniref:Jg23133 protein n=1 Tax=Pararge aegeria aegeria TaxID=348720 RepID=A0A8S4SE03_9NEOP|nr:jg23133 [Pararge aegeria aegeria]